VWPRSALEGENTADEPNAMEGQFSAFEIPEGISGGGEFPERKYEREKKCVLNCAGRNGSSFKSQVGLAQGPDDHSGRYLEKKKVLLLRLTLGRNRES